MTDFIDLDGEEANAPKTRAEFLAALNHYEALAMAAEDAELVFEIMALKERLGLPVSQPCVPPN